MADKKPIELINRKAAYEYSFLDELTVGIQLMGTEIKSIRAGNVNMRDAYCVFKKGELWLRSMFVAEYKEGNQFNHEERRTRKLLLKKRELTKWKKKVKEKGFTIVPYRLYVNERGFAKLEIVLAQGKKVHDKRESIKRKDNKRALDRAKKYM